jgi:DNA-binding GntR family transcriptional regulator
LNLNSKSAQNKRTFEPVKDPEDIKRIRKNLSKKPRDLLLFDLATQTGIGMKKLLQLKVKNLIGVDPNGKIDLKPSVNNKYSVIMTDTVYDTFHKYPIEVRPKPDDHLFKSKKGQQPLKLTSVSSMIKGWFKEANIEGSSAAISLRKTWEYHKDNNTQVNKETTAPKPKFNFKPLDTTTAQERIYQELFQAIVSRKIPPGSKLTTSEISKGFNVSHAPVRVALNWLEAKGFIESRKKKGSIVKGFTKEELHELVEIRIILESAAARMSYKIRTEETLNLLESIIEKCSSIDDYQEADQFHRLFHQTLFRDANRPQLVKMIIDLYDRFSPYAALAYRYTSHRTDYDSDRHRDYYHFKILEGMHNKDLNMILKNLKMDLKSVLILTEKALDARERSLSI